MFVKCDDIWLSHKLPELHVSDGEVLQGQQYRVFPPLVAELLKLNLRSIMLSPGRLMLCIDMERCWGKTWAEVGNILAMPNILKYNGAIAWTRFSHVRTLWVNHRLRRGVWHRGDKTEFMPMLIKELLKCHNVQKLIVFRKQFSGISVVQQHSLPWSLTEKEMLAVLEQPWIKDWINR